jgi:hypothetical protein
MKEAEDKANQVKALGDPAWKKRMFFWFGPFLGLLER